jgi:hypothetical protein
MPLYIKNDTTAQLVEQLAGLDLLEDSRGSAARRSDPATYPSGVLWARCAG